MANFSPTEHGDMDRLTAYWRARPDLLRQAITVERAPYQVTPKLGHGFRSGEYLVGESNGGTVLIGIVLVGECTTAGCVEAVTQAVGFLKQNEDAFPHRKSGRKPGPKVRLEVFLPPGVFPETVASLEGIRIQWFRWLPVDEQLVTVEKLAADAAATGVAAGAEAGVVARLLGHLAWWAQALRDGTGTETPYRQALLVYNAATLLEWHVTVPDRAPQEHLPDAKANKATLRAVNEFANAVRARVTKIEGASDEKAVKQLGKLAADSAKILKKLLKLFGCVVSPERIAEYEEPIKPASLVTEWLTLNEARGTASASHHLLATGPEAFVLPSLAPALAAQKLFEEGTLAPVTYTAVRAISAEFLEPAVAIAVQESKGSQKKRWRKVGGTALEALGRSLEPRPGKGES
jgi:hypothetical protein